MLMELGFEPVIHKEDSTIGAVKEALKSNDDRTTEALWLFCSEMMVTAYQDCMRHSQNRFEHI